MKVTWVEVAAGRKFFPSADVQQMVADFLAVSLLRNNTIEEKKYHQLMWWPEQPFNMTLMSSRASNLLQHLFLLGVFPEWMRLVVDEGCRVSVDWSGPIIPLRLEGGPTSGNGGAARPMLSTPRHMLKHHQPRHVPNEAG